MLFVFRVDTGTMLQMDMNLAIATVAELKNNIQKTCKIAPEKQVLLINGGESLDLTARVCHYSAGTDTNPIYLFCKNSEDSCSSPPHEDPHEIEVTDKVERSLELPATYETVVKRSALAKSLCELGQELLRDCEKIIHDQHLQQQGWAAAIANLEDMADFFRERSVAFQQDYQAHLDVREENIETLKNFSNELLTLARIPILPPLLASAISLSGLDLDTKVTTMTLLDWISAKDNQSSLQAVAEQCSAFLQQTDSSVLESLVKSVNAALDVATKTDMKEIKGLTGRLIGLDQLMVRAKRIVQEQSELAQAFKKNQSRANHLADESILPDLCASHKKQLLLMLESHSKLNDIHRRCEKAKGELSDNLHHRLSWVAFAQNEMQAVGNNLMIYQESLKRGRRHLLIIRQVQRAPEMYCLAVAEVVRRRKFSSAFLGWATDLSNRLLATYNEESERRRDFKVQFDGHFLEFLFPGLDDEPSTFATKAPEPFDVYIPHLSERDMEILRETLPELALQVSWTELSSVAQMFLSKSQVEKEEVKNDLPLEDRITATVCQIGLSDKMDEALLRPDDSATNKSLRDPELSGQEECQKIYGSEEENIASHEKANMMLHEQLSQASELVVSAAASLRIELTDLRSSSIAEKDSLIELVGQIHRHIVQLTESYASQMTAIQDQLALSEQKANDRICELEKLLIEKDELVKIKEKNIIDCRLEMEKEIENISNFHQKSTLSLKETYRIREEEASSEKKRLMLEIIELKSDMDQINVDFEVKEKSITDELNRNWCLKMSQKNEEYDVLVNNLKATAETEKNRLEECIVELRDNLVRTELTAEIETVNTLKEHAKVCSDLEERLTAENEKKIHDMQKEHQSAIEELTERLGIEHQNELQEVTNRLTSEYRTEIGSLRSRFRLMSITSMEKSPSDSSLEKIERGDMIELSSHEAIVGQMNEDAEVAQEKAVAEAIQAEQQLSKARLEESIAAAKARMEEEKQVWLEEAVNRAIAERERQFEEQLRVARVRIEEDRQILMDEAVAVACAEKDKQIEAMTERHHTLMTECQRHRDTIRRLTDNDHMRSGAGTVDPLLERVDNLEKEKLQLKEELNVVKQIAKEAKTDDRRRRIDSEGGSNRISLSFSESESREGRTDDMSQSVAVMAMETSCRGDIATSPELSNRVRNRPARNVRDCGGMISISGCNADDSVLVLWNVEYSNYMILQDSPTLYFLHADCLDTLGLRPSSDGSPRRLYAIAKVVKKEYCNARRSENRYRVACGTKFYRVTVKAPGRDRDSQSSTLPSIASGEKPPVS